MQRIARPWVKVRRSDSTVLCAIFLLAGSVRMEAQSAGDSAAGHAIALTPASTFVAMNPAMLGDVVRTAIGYNYAHKPGWRTSGVALNIRDFRIQVGSGHFGVAPRESEYFVGLDFARALVSAPVISRVKFILGADVSAGYGAIEFQPGNGAVGQTMGGFISAALRARFGDLTIIPFFAPGFFLGKYTQVDDGFLSSQSGRRLTQGGGVRVEVADRLNIEFGVRKTRIGDAVPRYGMAIDVSELPLPRGAQSNIRNLRLEMDNDFLIFGIPPQRRPDDDYTNGLRVSFDRSEPLKALAALTSFRPACGDRQGPAACAVARIEIGQEIYTPTGDSFFNLKFDRPYAGWLYGSYSGSLLTNRDDRSITLTAGVIGPQSFAEKVQTAFHALFPWYRHPSGWGSQLKFEPGIVASLTHRYLAGGSGPLAEYVQVIPEWKISIGNVLTGGSAGARARIGYKIPAPWSLSAARGSRIGAYAFAGFREDLVLHDIFLDGNTFRGHAQVHRVPWVWQRETGAGVRVGFVTAEYRAVLRQREYRVGNFDPCSVFACATLSALPIIAPILDIPKSHPYGTLSITIDKSF
jgi:lipid A 3-O-deacylase